MALSARNQEKQHERILKELQRLPDNKKCFDCDSVGPQYVVSNYNIFVCTSCSGVHRQFGHRVKGVSMCTFKPEEIRALQHGGNARFAAIYLAKWQPSALPKPADRSTERVRDWIKTVFDSKRFCDEAGAPAAATAAAASQSAAAPPPHPAPAPPAAAPGGEPPVKPLAEVLGSSTPKLQVGGRTDSLEHSASKASSTAPQSPPPRSMASPAARQINLLDVSSPVSAQAPAIHPPSNGASAAAAAAPWDAFAAPPAAGVPPAEGSWDAFGSGNGAAAASGAPASSTPAAAKPPAAPAVPATPWEAFGEDMPSPAAPAGGPAIAARSVAAPSGAAQQAPAAAALPGGLPALASSPQQPHKAPPRVEVPLDVFYPEFEQIRATGILPTGQPVPRPLYAPPPAGYPPAAAGYAAYGAPPPQQQYVYAQQRPQYGAQKVQYGLPPQQQYGAPQQQYSAPQRPTVVVPGQYGGYGAPSPALQPGAALSPGAYSPAGGFPSPGGIPSPAGSGFSAGGGVPSNGHAAGYDLRSSTASLPGGASQQHPRLGEPAPDPFSSLAPGLRGALPQASAAPPPAAATPAANGSPAGKPAALPAHAVAASATLFGGPPSLAAMPYNLAAPAAPKPKSSGNPFA